MKQSGIHHRKTLRLMRELGIEQASAVGLMEMFWHWAGDNALSGDVTGMDRDIEDGVKWWGDPGKLVPAMVSAEWLDRVGDRIVIHDWAEECPDYIRKRMNRKGKESLAIVTRLLDVVRRLLKIKHIDGETPEDVARRISDHLAGVGNRPKPVSKPLPQEAADPGALPFTKDLPETNQRKSKKDPLYTEAFEAAWEAYDRRGSKGAAARAYRDAINYVKGRKGEPDGDPHEWMLGRIELWASINASKDRQYWKHLERWLRDRLYDFDESAERASAPGAKEDMERRQRQEQVRALMEDS